MRKWHIEHADGRRWTLGELDGYVRDRCDESPWRYPDGPYPYAAYVDGRHAIGKVVDSVGNRWDIDGPDMVVVEDEARNLTLKGSILLYGFDRHWVDRPERGLGIDVWSPRGVGVTPRAIMEWAREHPCIGRRSDLPFRVIIEPLGVDEW